MSYTNGGLIEAFVQGKTSGKCNRMAIEDGPDDWTFLWGYGHALYAARRENGPLYVYMGWYGRSSTTSTHLNKLKGRAKGAYGEPRDDGEQVRVKLHGDGDGEVLQRPPKGRVLVAPEEGQPGTNYGRFNTADRPELSDFEDHRPDAPGGTSSGSGYR